MRIHCIILKARDHSQGGSQRNGTAYIIVLFYYRIVGISGGHNIWRNALKRLKFIFGRLRFGNLRPLHDDVIIQYLIYHVRGCCQLVTKR